MAITTPLPGGKLIVNHTVIWLQFLQHKHMSLALEGKQQIQFFLEIFQLSFGDTVCSNTQDRWEIYTQCLLASPTFRCLLSAVVILQEKCMMMQDCDKEQSKINNQTTLKAPGWIKTKNQRYNLISINILLEMMSVNFFPTDFVVVSSGCHNKTLQTVLVKQQILIFSQFGGLEVLDQNDSMVGLCYKLESSLSGHLLTLSSHG